MPSPVTRLPVLPTLWALQHSPLRLMRDLYAREPGVFVSSLLGRKYLILSDPDLVRHVLLENRDNYRKNYGAFMQAVGHSSVTQRGEKWQAVRRINQKAFRSDHLAGVIEANRGVIDRFAQTLEAPAASGEGIDLSRLLGALMLSMTANGMFARHTRQTPDEIYNDVECFLPIMDRCAVSVTALGRWFVRRSDPGFRDALRRWRAIPGEVLADAPSRDPEGSLLTHLVAACKADGAMNSDAVHDELRLFLLAGSQTSAASIGFALFLLWRHPAVLQQVRAELDERGSGAAPDVAGLDRLTLLSHVLSETLRLFPPVWAISRVAIGEDEIAGIPVKCNDVVIISYYGLHRSPVHWSAPGEFDPSRFAQSAAATRRGYVYLPFGAGPRACIGAQLAAAQAVSVLAAILSRFDVEFLRVSADLADGDLRPGISLWPKQPLEVRLKVREGSATRGGQRDAATDARIEEFVGAG